MKSSVSPKVVRSGDYAGLGRIYTAEGELLCFGGESILKVCEGWDLDVMSPWRRESILKVCEGWDLDVMSPWRQVLPHVVFEGFGGKVKSRLYITSERIVLIRDIDPWRELKGEMTPLGIPNASIKEARLKRLIRAGARQFCELRPQNLHVVKSKILNRRRSWMDLQLIGIDGKQYGITIWKTDGRDPGTLALIDSRFPRQI